jgi:cell division protein FtsL
MDATFHSTRTRVEQFMQAYKEAPWRTQRKWITLFLIGTIAVGMVAGIYLTVTSRAVLAGRETQALEEFISTNSHINADLETQLATSLSTNNMKKRAEEMGFQMVDLKEIDYVVVPGYFPSQTGQLSLPHPSKVSPKLDPRYSESLFEWFDKQLQSAATR